MCADIHDGREQTFPSKGRIQMSKTNNLQIIKSGLHRTAGPYRWVKMRLGGSAAPFPFLPPKADLNRRRHIPMPFLRRRRVAIGGNHDDRNIANMSRTTHTLI